MKKLKLNVAKLQLTKEKIASLSTEESGVIHGGGDSVVIIKPTTGPGATAGCTDAGCTTACPQSALNPCVLTVMCTFRC